MQKAIEMGLSALDTLDHGTWGTGDDYIEKKKKEWTEAFEKMQAGRGDMANMNVEIPPSATPGPYSFNGEGRMQGRMVRDERGKSSAKYAHQKDDTEPGTANQHDADHDEPPIPQDLEIGGLQRSNDKTPGFSPADE
ncbi:hypothetical protein HK102_005356 [Quaeritorhiza haematococci]|nr:hypothetical protein HK102_005356 [Quaeritorhiza haematococci]